MIEKLINSFSKFGPLSQGEKDAIIESTEIREFKKGEYLLREGGRSLDSYFVLKGCIRQFLHRDGEEKTTRFFVEDEWVISVTEDPESTVSTHNWICMEDCTLVVGDEQKAQALFEQQPQLESLARKIMESSFAEIHQSFLFYHAATPEERYLKLQNDQESILQRVPQYHIASFIGVKPESLSRIRKRVAQGS